MTLKSINTENVLNSQWLFKLQEKPTAYLEIQTQQVAPLTVDLKESFQPKYFIVSLK